MRYTPHLAALALTALPAGADPVALGEEIYGRICRECHGATAVESFVGDIRGLSLATITGAVRSGPGMMPTIPLSSEEIAAVVAYLADLRRR